MSKFLQLFSQSSMVLTLAFAVLSFSNIKAQTMVTALSADSVCAGDSVQLAASFNGSMSATFTWVDTTGANSVNPTMGDTVWVKPTATTHYQVIGDTNGVKDTSYFTVKVFTSSNVQMTLSDSTACPGDSITLMGTGAPSYTWSFGGTTLGTGMTLKVRASSVSGEYKVTGGSGSCASRDSAMYTAKAAPRESVTRTIDVFTVPESPTTFTFVCFDELLTVKAQNGNNAYKWSIDNGLTLSDTVGPQTTVTMSLGGTMTLVIDSANGCSSTIRMPYAPNTSKPNLRGFWLTNDTICEGDTASMFLTGGAMYDWTPTSTIVDAKSDTGKMFPTVTTSYTYKAYTDGCTASATAKVNVNPAPDISLSQSSNGAPICKDEADTITVTSNLGVLFDWGYGVTSTAKVKEIAPGKTETITVTAFSSNGCGKAASIVINVDTTCGGNLSVQGFEAQNEIRSYLVSGSELYVSFGNVPIGEVQVEVLDLTGSVVVREDLGMIEPNNEKIVNVNGLSSGVFLIRIKGEGYEAVNKIYR